MAFAVCTALENAGLRAVLTGGSAATWYAPAACQSRDLDFVIVLNGKAGKGALAAIGFHEDTIGLFRHRATHLSIDYLNGPIAVGEDEIVAWSTARRGAELLHVLTPTDSVRNRLEPFLSSNDFAVLEQALAVFRACREQVDLAKVEDWCRREGRPEQFRLFAARCRLPP